MAVSDVAALYRRLSRTAGLKAAALVALLPVRLIDDAFPPEGVVVDIGCGEGVLSVALAKSSSRRRVVGIERDPRLVANARRAAHDVSNLRFLEEDALNAVLPDALSAALFSLSLHHMDADAQEEILRRAAGALRPGGVIAVVEVSGSWLPIALARALDLAFFPADKPCYRGAESWLGLLAAGGLKPRREALRGPSPLSLYIGVKR